MKTPRLSLQFVAIAGLCLILLAPARGANTILHSFTGGASDGRYPQGSLTLSGSKLFGMAYDGGGGNDGAIFSMNTDGTGFGLLHSFAASDGSFPTGSLTLSGSKLYGMTSDGGGSGGGGSVFSMNTDGTGFSLLHHFIASDGRNPYGSLTLSGSKLYGMTQFGGSSNAGTLFSMNTDGTGFGVLHTFTGGVSNGSSPFGSLTLFASKLYGMTSQGGSIDQGTIFSMNTDGSSFGLLHSFTHGTGDGAYPQYADMVLSGDHSTLFGMTVAGGSGDAGTIFRMNTDGTGFGVVHSFTGGTSDGSYPLGSLTLTGSKLYGMTRFGGGSDAGTLFSANTDGSNFGLLHSFTGGASDGRNPYGSLTLSGDASTLYGMTYNGGTADRGVIFSETNAPEPTCGALLGMGILLLIARRRGTNDVS